MYLDRQAVESTLRKIAGTATGGGVAFDCFSAEIIPPAEGGGSGYAKKVGTLESG
jgi:hypothetical protein